MRYLVLACDYDETLGVGGRVARETVAALERLLASGRKLILVTGRELDDVLRIFPHAGLFERIIAENGAVLYRPASREKSCWASPRRKNLFRRCARKGSSRSASAPSSSRRTNLTKRPSSTRFETWDWRCR